MAFIGSSTTPANFQKLEEGIKVTGNDITDGNDNVIFSQSNNHVPKSILQYVGFNIEANKGLSYDSIDDDPGNIELNDTVILDFNASDASGKFLSEGSTTNELTLNLGEGIREDPNDAGNLALDETVGFTFTSSITLDAGATLGGDIDADTTGIIKNLPEPSDVKDAARKGYVDGVAQGLEIKESVRYATAGNNIDLSSTSAPTIDGKSALDDGDRVLLKDQTTASENGIYKAGDPDETSTASDPTTWTRAEDFDTDDDVVSGAFAFVYDGNTNADTSFTVTNQDPVGIADGIEFSQFASAGEILGGDGLSKSGQTLSIAPGDFISGGGLQVDGSDIKVNLDSTLQVDGSDQISINEGNSLTFTAEQTFNSGIDVGADISDGTDTIYSSSNTHVPEAILETLSNSALTNSSITVNANNGLDVGSIGSTSDSETPSLGGSVGLVVNPNDFIDTTNLQYDADDNNNISIKDNFLFNDGDTLSGTYTVSDEIKFQDFFELQPRSGAPPTPTAGNQRVFIDNNDNNLKVVSNDGSGNNEVVTLVST